MNLRKATLFLILGSVYTIFHKVAYALFPTLGGPGLGRAITSVLWILSTFALILFAYQYLIELSPKDSRMRYSLIGIIVFTSGVILSKLFFGEMPDSGVAHRVVFGVSGLFNSFAILIFALSLARFVSKGTTLWLPIRALICGCGVTAILGIVSIGYFAAYLLTGQEIPPLPFLQPLSVLAFLFTYGATIWFLVKFRLIENYKDFARR